MDTTFFLYDQATQKITSYVQVLTDSHDKIKDYVANTYSAVSVTVNGTWMRLDFDSDGSVSVDDLKKSVFGLYEFLKNFDVIEKTTQVKSQLYTDAIAYMQQELDEMNKEQPLADEKVEQAAEEKEKQD